MGQRRRDKKQRKLTTHQTNQQALYAQQQLAQSQALIAEQQAQTAMLRAQSAAVQTGPADQGAGRWLADPVGRFSQRWWNGTEWTSHVVDAGGQQTSDPQPVNTLR